ncbi:MAG: TAT-variant-translocated molybdopterin oxidoreductase, partial [Candidatus Zixiibacteriota bacterium]
MSTQQKSSKGKSLPAREHWRSMEQLADTPEFRRFVENEFPYGIEQMDNSWSRRNFMTLMGASLALAGLSGCRRPVEKIVPYVKAPEETLPGIGKHYATAMPFGSDAYGLVVETHEGRPTKVEGNNQHPSTLGRSTALIQASILNLYDPDRSQSTLNNGETKEYSDFVAGWVQQYSGLKESRGEGLAILSPTLNSPTIARQKSEFLKAFPKATWTAYDSISDENIVKAIKVTTGRAALPVYHLEAADVIVAIDADPLSLDSQSITSAAGFAAGRRVTTESDSMNRLYVVETGFSLTGSAADNRLRLKNQEIGPFVVALGFSLKAQGLKLPGFDQLQMPTGAKVDKKWVMAVASDLIKAKGKSLVMVGRRQAPAIHAAALAINEALDNIGSTITYHDAPDLVSSDLEQLRLLCAEMKGGKVNTLVMLGGNPVYDAPRDLEFERALSKVETSIHLGSHVNETARKVTWHIPRAHYMEAWSDARSVDGTASIVQPMIAPLFGGKSEMELVGLISSGEEKSGYDEV